MLTLPIDSEQIVITASRSEEELARTLASAAIIDQARIERLGEPLLAPLLRFTPSLAVTTQGPTGLFTEVRIRGAENNHTLLFIDGIRANDPATGDFARFELLNADLASRIEIVRGPQSALWGSDAIGGVVAVNGNSESPGFGAAAEAGSFGFRRASASGALVSSEASLAGGLGWQRADGIDSFGSPGGDRDGYRNLSGRVRGSYRLSPAVELGAAAFALTGRSQFDGYDPDRKVLLYAKLFRRLRRHPKEWGLRGWDGPVLNEAKRQVRAAAKAGGVPIEWHIGLEEPAHAVRQLLADHTDITDQQLSVIYTPVEQAHQQT